MHNVALFSDKYMLPGLHVTLCSLLEALPERAPELIINIFLDKVSETEKQLLDLTIRKSGKN